MTPGLSIILVRRGRSLSVIRRPSSLPPTHGCIPFFILPPNDRPFIHHVPTMSLHCGAEDILHTIFGTLPSLRAYANLNQDRHSSCSSSSSSSSSSTLSWYLRTVVPYHLRQLQEKKSQIHRGKKLRMAQQYMILLDSGLRALILCHLLLAYQPWASLTTQGVSTQRYSKSKHERHSIMCHSNYLRWCANQPLISSFKSILAFIPCIVRYLV